MAKKIRPDKSVIKRYIIYQLPGIFVLFLLLLLIRQWFSFSIAVFALILGGWMLKDVMMFFFVWKSYDPKKPIANTMIGEKGIAVEDINPAGYVQINGVLWQAKAFDSLIQKHEKIRVIDSEGIKLVVEKEENEIQF